MLRGHATAKVDTKGRIKIPSLFLDEFLAFCGAERKVYVTSFDGDSILAFPLPVWEEQEKEILERPAFDPDAQDFLRVTSFWGRTTAVDAQGRLLLHPLLRESADIDGELSVFGKQRVLEMSNFQRLLRERPRMSREQLHALTRYGA